MFRYSWPHIPLAGQSWLQVPTVGLWLPKASRRLDCWLQAWLDGGSDDITAFLRSPAVNRYSLTHSRLSVVTRENWRAEARGSVLMCMATFTAYDGNHVGKATGGQQACRVAWSRRGVVGWVAFTQSCSLTVLPSPFSSSQERRQGHRTWRRRTHADQRDVSMFWSKGGWCNEHTRVGVHTLSILREHHSTLAGWFSQTIVYGAQGVSSTYREPGTASNYQAGSE
jgi:hypothetical protein